MLPTLAQFGSIHSEWRNELSPQGLVGLKGRKESHGCWLDQVSFLEWCPISEIQTRDTTTVLNTQDKAAGARC